MMSRTELLLYLDTMAYFPEFAKSGFGTVGEFLDSYASAPADKRPTTMFNSFCSDETSGVYELMLRLRSCGRIRRLRFACDSADTKEFSSVCLTDDAGQGASARRDIYIIIGGNYRIDEYEIEGEGKVCTWSDNLLGAVIPDTPEQRSILRFYDRALVCAGYEDRRCTVTVSGHSKAGNLAQYITVFRDSVDRCVSFEAQGFSKEFIKKHRTAVAFNASKIVSICPDMSVVGVLLHQIPGSQRRYVQSGFLRQKGAHIMPLYYHLPTALLDEDFHLRSPAAGCRPISDMLRRTAGISLWLAGALPFIDREKGLNGLGRALMHGFKEYRNEAVEELKNKDTVGVMAAEILVLLAAAPVYIAAELIERALPYRRKKT